MSNRLDIKVIEDLVRYVEQTSLPGRVQILLMGGEPLYDVDVAVSTIKDLVRSFSRSGRNEPRFKLLTNGLNLSDFVESLGSDSSLVRCIQVSLDQDRETHDSVKRDRAGNPTFDRVISGVKCAVQAGIPITLRLNIHDPAKVEQILHTCSELYDEVGTHKFLIYPALVLQRPLAAKNRRWSV